MEATEDRAQRLAPVDFDGELDRDAIVAGYREKIARHYRRMIGFELFGVDVEDPRVRITREGIIIAGEPDREALAIRAANAVKALVEETKKHDRIAEMNKRYAPVVVSKQPAGRNDLCPCGSKKKYKRCCLRSAKG